MNAKLGLDVKWRKWLASTHYLLACRIISEQPNSLSKIQVNASKVFANDHLRWIVEDWTMNFFSVKADLLPTKGGELCVRLRRKQNQLDEVLEARPKRNLTIKVWGSISYLEWNLSQGMKALWPG